MHTVQVATEFGVETLSLPKVSQFNAVVAMLNTLKLAGIETIVDARYGRSGEAFTVEIAVDLRGSGFGACPALGWTMSSTRPGPFFGGTRENQSLLQKHFQRVFGDEDPFNKVWDEFWKLEHAYLD